MGSAILSADACSNKFVLDLRQRAKPTLKARESHPSILRDLSEVLHTGDEEYEQSPLLNQELEEKIASAQSQMIAHGRARGERQYTGGKGGGQNEPSEVMRLHANI